MATQAMFTDELHAIFNPKTILFVISEITIT